MLQRRSQRIDSPFTIKEETWIILEYGRLRTPIAVRRAFMKEFSHYNPKNIPGRKAFQRVIKHFLDSAGHTLGHVPNGRPTSLSEADVNLVKNFVERKAGENEEKVTPISVSQISRGLGLSRTTVWRIVWKKLGW